jgi:hypothetical protein
LVKVSGRKPGNAPGFLWLDLADSGDWNPDAYKFCKGSGVAKALSMDAGSGPGQKAGIV